MLWQHERFQELWGVEDEVADDQSRMFLQDEQVSDLKALIGLARQDLRSEHVNDRLEPGFHASTRRHDRKVLKRLQRLVRRSKCCLRRIGLNPVQETVHERVEQPRRIAEQLGQHHLTRIALEEHPIDLLDARNDLFLRRLLGLLLDHLKLAGYGANFFRQNIHLLQSLLFQLRVCC